LAGTSAVLTEGFIFSFCRFPQALQVIGSIVSDLVQDPFFQNPFQFVISHVYFNVFYSIAPSGFPFDGLDRNSGHTKATGFDIVTVVIVQM
jgi:hypothetical protein